VASSRSGTPARGCGSRKFTQRSAVPPRGMASASRGLAGLWFAAHALSGALTGEFSRVCCAGRSRLGRRCPWYRRRFLAPGAGHATQPAGCGEDLQLELGAGPPRRRRCRTSLRFVQPGCEVGGVRAADGIGHRGPSSVARRRSHDFDFRVRVGAYRDDVRRVTKPIGGPLIRRCHHLQSPSADRCRRQAASRFVEVEGTPRTGAEAGSVITLRA